ncbi:(R,S)-reticuline 7-O-methyltransferase [Morella rubra]|uniref:(R,S)-reticuline 7-O-methyltransferase n=1 Tax=Morella rubra TaxID=262757 RepID=A0A6A1V134_9ROSI|nr:(R,S)-reticuline 7-O-methyltransferase [Morella rubra]
MVLAEYKDGFDCVGSLVDVGSGGTGGMIAEIVKSHPHIRGINFDLPHVVATAPVRERVSHVGGDMFEAGAIPDADAIFMKGKLIIVDIVLEKDSHDLFDKTRMVFDLLMMAHTASGKERTELEWKELLTEGGFRCYKIIKIPTIPSIIEAYPIQSLVQRFSN